MGLYSIVEFKGTKEGLVLQFLERRSINELISNIKEKIIGKEMFFKGAKIVGVEGILLDQEEKSLIQKLFEDELNIEVSSLDQYQKKTFVKVENTSVPDDYEGANTDGVFEGLETGVTKFIKGTLRSGKSVEFEGNLVILGDVNPGAEVVAFGNIIVMGTLRGVAHAGANGNDNAYVVANKLLSKQIRISRFITRAEDNEGIASGTPELACIKGDVIVIEPYL